MLAVAGGMDDFIGPQTEQPRVQNANGDPKDCPYPAARAWRLGWEPRADMVRPLN